jgi:hypothetical protein
MRRLNQCIVLFAAMLLPLAWAEAQSRDEAPGQDRPARENPPPNPAPALGRPGQPVPVLPGATGALRPGEDLREAQMRRATDSLRFMVVQGKKEKAAFLGVTGSPVTAALSEQLKLPRGIGMIVDFVEPKSPADEAGVKRYDIIHKLDDQLIVNAHQLAVLVRIHKPGDEITLTVIHQGESKPIKAKLIEKEVMALDERNPWGTPSGPWEHPEGAEVLAYAPMTLGLPPTGGFAAGSVLNRINVAGDTYYQIQTADDKGTLTVTHNKSGRRLLAKDKDGRTIFDGPIDTPEQRAALPADLQEKLNRMPPNPMLPPGAATQPGSVPGFWKPGIIHLERSGNDPQPESGETRTDKPTEPARER